MTNYFKVHIALLSILIYFPSVTASANARSSFYELAKRCAPKVHPRTMVSLIKVESSFNQYAVGVNKGKKKYKAPKNKSEAQSLVNILLANNENFDVGLAQINSNNFKWLKLDLNDLFEPCKNLQAAQKVLLSCYKKSSKKGGSRRGILIGALSCYNTGRLKRGVSNGYVVKIVKASAKEARK